FIPARARLADEPGLGTAKRAPKTLGSPFPATRHDVPSRLSRAPTPSGPSAPTRPAKRTRERQLIMDLPQTNPPSARGPAPHLSAPVSLSDRSIFTAPPLLPGLVDQIRIQLGPKAKPTPVQSLSLDHFFDNNHVISRKDTLLAAETGSGKSLAYLLPIVQALKETEPTATRDDSLPAPRALILTPTHELARQVKSMLSHLTHAPDTKLRSVCVSSGSSASLSARYTSLQLDEPNASLDGSSELRIEAPTAQGIRSVDVVIGTPAKILDLTRPRGRHSVGPRRPGDDEVVRREVQREVKMSLAAVEWVVVDEADVLFDPDFSVWTEAIIQDIRAARPDQSSRANLILTTATVSAQLSSYLSQHYPNLVRLTTPNLHRLPASLQTEHVQWDRRPGNRYPTILRKLQDTWAEEAREHPNWQEKSKIVIFCNRSKKVDELGAFLEDRGVRCVCLTSESDNRQWGNNRHIESFTKPLPGKKQREPRPDEPRVLITTSLLSRGLDFSSLVRSVFIVDEPRNEVDYIHRAGRAGRAGRPGKVVVFSKESVGGEKRLSKGTRKVWAFDAA
ncbi:RNA helicase, partial [Ceratobasidium sp. 370]